VSPPLTEPKQGEVIGQANEPVQDTAPTINNGRKITTGLKETVSASSGRADRGDNGIQANPPMIEQ
jgi:hypothetical protein